MKKIVLFSLMMACMPFMVLAQSGNDDLYYIPKKKKEQKEKVETKTVVKTEQASVAGSGNQVTTPIVVRDVNGNTRDLDEYNRRYTSRENEFTYENDTLYIQEKPYLEQGEWINGFEGSQEDYDYAMRIIRFRSPRFAVSISSPYYWDIISLGYTTGWNVFDTGMYAFAFPTFTNSWWWDWRYNSMLSIRYYPSNWLYRSGWYYSSWYDWGYPYHHHHYHWHHFPHHHHYAHGGWGGYWGNNHGWYGSSAHNPGIHAGRYSVSSGKTSVGGRTQGNSKGRASRNDYLNNRRTSRNDQTVNRGNAGSVRSSAGRVVTNRNSSSSVRPQRSASKSRSGHAVSSGTGTSRSSGVYTRQSQGKGSSYNRASSTRSTVNNSGSWGNSGGRSGGYYNGGSSSSSGGSRSSSVSSGSSRSSSSSGSFSSGGGGGRSASSGGSSRGSGGRR